MAMNFKARRRAACRLTSTGITSVLFVLQVAFSNPVVAQSQVFEQQVKKGNHDAEEFATGSVYLKSTDLELTADEQTVGVLFDNVKVPQGAFIQNAYIQFQTDETSSLPTSLSVQGEASNDARKYSATTYDISSRPRTSAAVSWEPPAWLTVAERGPAQRTPDLSTLVQEIVNNPNWKDKNAMAFVITGSGQRTAESREGSKDGAPLLHVEFGDESLPPPSDASFSELDVRLNGLTVGEDSANKRLLVPLPAGYAMLSEYSATIDHQLVEEGFSVGFNNDATVRVRTAYNFGAVEYGSEFSIQMYQNGQFIDDYTLVFTNLPIIELDAATIVDEPKNPGSFTLNAGTAAQSVPETAMGIEFRGSTSQDFEKKSFGLELREEDDPSKEKNVALLGLRKDGDWILDAVYRDTSFVRNIVGQDIFNDMRPFAYGDDLGEPKGQAALRGTQVEVILNGSYHGVYVLSERIDRKLLDLPKIDVPEDAEGNELWNEVDFTNPENGSVIYKADENLADFYHPEALRTDFEQEYPDADDIDYFEPLEALMQFVNTANDEEFLAIIGSLVDIDRAVDFWLLTNVTGDTDTLKKNYFLARAGAGKWFFVPWDKDASFSMLWTGARDNSTTFWNPQGNQLLRRLIELPETGFNLRMKIRWNELRGGQFSQATLTRRFADYHASVEPVAGNPANARERNFQRWPESGNEGADDRELGTVPFIDSWIGERLQFLDATIAGQPE